MLNHPSLWYRDKDSLRIGGVSRYIVEYTRLNSSIEKIYFRLKNIEKSSIRAIHLLSGPFILYCHVVPCNYNPKKQFYPDDMTKNSEVVFENQIKPNQALNVTLLLNKNSLKHVNEDGDEVFQWEIEVISQIVITNKTEVVYDFLIGDNLSFLKKLGHNIITETLTSLKNKDTDTAMSEVLQSADLDEPNKVYNPSLKVTKKTTDDIWSNEPKDPKKPVHLIIVTHGIFSNLTADMLYIKDQLEAKVKENILVRGYRYNAGRTEKGVRKLGTNVAEYIVALIETSDYKYDKISFIGHSLGGLVQSYAIKYILMTRGTDYFEKKQIKPTNFIGMASPFLGILNEMNFLISWVLDIGTLGKTGRDLTLSKRLPAWSDIGVGDSKKRHSFKPILETLPDDPLSEFLSKFDQLVVYANAVNDGIVPLRTSALLYLDYEALGDVSELKKSKHIHEHPELEETGHPIEANRSRDTISEIPEEEDNQMVKDIENAEGESSSKSTSNHFLGLGKYNDFLNLSSSEPTTTHKHHHKLSRRQKRYKNFSVKGTESNLFSEFVPENSSLHQQQRQQQQDEEQSESTEDDTQSIIVPPRASAIESAISTIICPVPSTQFLINPDIRQHVIFHDKYYHFNTPPEHDEANKHSKLEWLTSVVLRYHSKWKLEKQKLIADKYHSCSGWRKVLVNLPPDAHNNIVVRRRFANGYGWGVIDHLCDLFRVTENKL
ncbi:Lipase, putative [Candida maltosa Xu316]|uniref:Lipase, putative n=1 Tax=Candida maltosa (strain Xu316) TaxID=1245528 RepID=M3J2T2_CANMX|nr:Lipase, putative [Candida maltosa Xu316]